MCYSSIDTCIIVVLIPLQVLKGVCMEIMNSLFYTQPPADRLSAELNAKIITVSYNIIDEIKCIKYKFIRSILVDRPYRVDTALLGR